MKSKKEIVKEISNLVRGETITLSTTGVGKYVYKVIKLSVDKTFNTCQTHYRKVIDKWVERCDKASEREWEKDKEIKILQERIRTWQGACVRERDDSIKRQKDIFKDLEGESILSDRRAGFFTLHEGDYQEIKKRFK